MKNYRITPEMELIRRQKISQTLKGRTPANLSSLHLLPRTAEWRRKIGVGHKGLVHTEETKRRISDKKRNPLKPLYKAIRYCYKSKDWRIAIFRRDNYTCVICKKRGTELNADHFPKRFVDILRENKVETMEDAFKCIDLWDIKNGRTLCIMCHSKTDTWGNKFRRGQ